MPFFTILSLFPEALQAYLDVGVLAQGQARGHFRTRLVDFRDFARDRHRTVDDRPFGGGPGMVLKPEPIVEAVEWIENELGPHRRLVLCPSGRTFDQTVAQEYAEAMLAPAESDSRLLLICGRYEGLDERIYDELELERISLGRFVLAGGELAALCVVEAVARLLPGVLGDQRSAQQDSYDAREGSLGPLDHPHFTRPRSFRDRAVPEVLFSGDHARIDAWRQARARERTQRQDSANPNHEHPSRTDAGIGAPHPESDGTSHESD